MHLHLFPCNESLPIICCCGFHMECLECGQYHLLWISITPAHHPLCACTASPDTAKSTTLQLLLCVLMVCYARLFVRLRPCCDWVSLDVLTVWCMHALIGAVPQCLCIIVFTPAALGLCGCIPLVCLAGFPLSIWTIMLRLCLSNSHPSQHAQSL